ncbi:MAG: hypothetical protein ACE5OY_06975 [Candidatus Bathyarchaeia archaeon]
MSLHCRKRSLDYKGAINYLESRHPGTKLRLAKMFRKELKSRIGIPEEVLVSCQKCEMPTTEKVCAFFSLIFQVMSASQTQKRRG